MTKPLKETLFRLIRARKLSPEEKDRLASLTEVIDSAAQRVKEEKAARKKDAKSAKAMAIYDDRVTRMKAMLVEIEKYMPAADEIKKNIEHDLNAADEFLKGAAEGERDYKKAYELLHKSQHLHKAMAEAQELYDAKSQELRGAPGISEKQIELNRLLSEGGLFTIDRTRQFRGSIAAAEKKAMGNPDEFGGDLDLVIAEIREERTVAAWNRDSARHQLTLAEADLAKLTDLLPAESALLRYQLENAKRLFLDRDFHGALTVIGQLTVDCAQAEQAHAIALGEWESARKRIDPLKSGIGAAINQAEQRREQAVDDQGRAAEKEEIEELLALRGQLETVEEAFPVDGKVSPGNLSFQDAVRIVEQVADGLERIQARPEIDSSLGEKRAEAQQEVEQLLARARAELEVLQKRLEDAGEEVNVDSMMEPLQAALEEAQASWERRRDSARDAEGLGNGVELTRQEIEFIERRIPTVRDAEDTARLLRYAELAEIRKIWLEEWRRADEAIEGLTLIDVDAADPLRAELSGLAGKAAKTKRRTHLRQYVEAARLLADRAAKGMTGVEEELAQLQDRLMQSVDRVEGKLGELWTKIDKAGDNDKRNAYEQLHNALMAQVKAKKAVAQSKQKLLLVPSEEELDAIEGEVDEALSEFARGVGDKALALLTFGRKGGGPFEELKRRIDDAKTRLDGDVMTTFLGNTAGALTERLLAVEQALSTDGMVSSRTTLDGLMLEIGEAEKEAKTAKEQFETFEKNSLGRVRKLLDKVEFDAAPTAKKLYAESLDDLRGTARQQGGVNRAIPLLERIEADIIDGLDETPPFAAKEDEALKSQAAQALLGGKWEGDVEVLSKRIDAVAHLGMALAFASAVLERPLADERKALRERLDKADKMYKGGEHDMARAQYGAIERRLALIGQNPDGLRMHQRNHLMEVRARWGFAVDKLKAGVDDLLSRLEKAVDDNLDRDDARRNAEAQLNAAKSLFTSLPFEGDLAVLLGGKGSEAALGRAREGALREVRRLRSVVREDPRIRQLTVTFLGADLSGQVSEVNLALADVETNLLISQ